MNTVMISGNLTKDVEVKATNSGSFLNFSIANNDKSKKNAQGEWEDVVGFFECSYFSKNPQPWIQKLHKGAGVMIEGQLEQQSWQDKESGKQRSKVTVAVKKWPLMLAGKHDVAPTAPAPSFEDDSIPF